MRRLVWFVGLGTAMEASPALADDGRGLEVYFIDVAGGAATLIVSPEEGIGVGRYRLVHPRGSRPIANR